MRNASLILVFALGIFVHPLFAAPKIAVAEFCCAAPGDVSKPSLAAVKAAGFEPLVLIATNSDAVLFQQLKSAKAVMIPGYWPAQNTAARKAFTKRVLDIAIRQHKPILGVCWGAQEINRYFGGLVVSIPRDQQHLNHNPPKRRGVEVCHPITIERRTRLYRIIGGPNLAVNSSHTFQIGRLGGGLRVSARASDGVIEAIEHEKLSIIGLQFHPERMTGNPEILRLLKACLQRKSEPLPPRPRPPRPPRASPKTKRR